MKSSLFLAFFLVVCIGFSVNSLRRAVSEESLRPTQDAPQVQDTPQKESFRRTGLLPKEEIGALRLLKNHPEYDGRGTVVAIFDTGFDPGAPGLQTTTDGKPKVIDLIDGTGQGDVLTTTVVTSKNGTVEGLTGRTLKLDPQWENPTGKFHLGIKEAFDLFPSDALPRIQGERKKRFEATQLRLEAALQKQIATWDEHFPKANAEQKRMRKDLVKQLAQLQAAGKSYKDPGPVFDCVVFHDGKNWRAAIDTDEDGDLADEKALSNFRTEREFASFGDESQINFSVNIYENGKLLSIVVVEGAHGTHVAGIVSAHFPDQPELNGIAPGAQIVSVKIGDGRLGGMETSAGLVRGLNAVIENQCDLINMSFGESTHNPDSGRLIKLFSEIVNKHNVIFVSSAGNEGPALSTVGTPGGTTSAIVGVGAYVSPEMMKEEYTLRETGRGMPFTWTSRGPTFDGSLGVDIFAPGAAISPVPNWTLQKNMRMNGTSMSSPNCCGAIALLLSGMKAEKRNYTPYSIRRAFQNTARKIEEVEVFAQGPGLIQVDTAMEYLLQQDVMNRDLARYKVRTNRPHNRRGIYLRQPYETERPINSTITVSPIFPNSVTNKEKIDFDLRIALSSSEDWVKTGEFTLMTSAGSSFEVQVDPTNLEPGVHYAEIQGIETNDPSRGPLFRVPVTVIRHHEFSDRESATHREKLTFEPGQVVRRFFKVPQGATWTDLNLRTNSEDKNDRLFVVHLHQARYGRSIDYGANRQYIMLSHSKNVHRSYPVEAGQTLELCITQYWNRLGETELEYDLNFHGIEPDKKTVHLSASHPYEEVKISGNFRKERLSPSAKLTHRRRYLRPTSSKIKPLDFHRDVLVDGRQIHALELVYEFEQPTAGTVTPMFPQLDAMLYDSPVGTQLWILFDQNKKRIKAQDFRVEPVRLSAGKYTIHYQLRNENVSILKRYKNLKLCLETTLANAISPPVYETKIDAVNGSPSFRGQFLSAGAQSNVVVKAPTSLPSGLQNGDELIGKIFYGKSDSSPAGTGRHPSGYSLRYSVSGLKTGKTAASPNGSLKNRIRDAKLAYLKTLASGQSSKEFDDLFLSMVKDDPGYLPVYLAKLHRLDDAKFRKQRLEQVVQAADEVLKNIDTQKIAQAFGHRTNPEDSAAIKTRREMEKLREILADTLYRKGRALGYMELPEVVAKKPIADKKAHNAAFEKNFAELARWVDTTGKKYYLLHVRRERRRGNLGAALELLNRHIKGTPSYWPLKKRRDIYRELGWKHLDKNATHWLLRSFPKTYDSF